jgi:hypothetical protein
VSAMDPDDLHADGPDGPDHQTYTEVSAVVTDVAKSIPPDFVMDLNGKKYVTYPGLIWLLHQQTGGDFSVAVESVQLPADSNGQVAVVKATITGRVRLEPKESGPIVARTTSDLGDASAGSVNRMMVEHIIRMASTRAIARAARSFTNVGMVAAEELGGSGRRPSAPRPAKPVPGGSARESGESRGAPSTPAPAKKPVPGRDYLEVNGKRHSRAFLWNYRRQWALYAVSQGDTPLPHKPTVDLQTLYNDILAFKERFPDVTPEDLAEFEQSHGEES